MGKFLLITVLLWMESKHTDLSSRHKYSRRMEIKEEESQSEECSGSIDEQVQDHINIS